MNGLDQLLDRTRVWPYSAQAKVLKEKSKVSGITKMILAYRLSRG